MSHPSARELAPCRRVNSSTVSGRRIGRPPCSMQCANAAKSAAFEKIPACPATPPSTLAFSTCTSP